jgi:hypothetical protein
MVLRTPAKTCFTAPPQGILLIPEFFIEGTRRQERREKMKNVGSLIFVCLPWRRPPHWFLEWGHPWMLAVKFTFAFNFY